MSIQFNDYKNFDNSENALLTHTPRAPLRENVHMSSKAKQENGVDNYSQDGLRRSAAAPSKKNLFSLSIDILLAILSCPFSCLKRILCCKKKDSKNFIEQPHEQNKNKSLDKNTNMKRQNNGKGNFKPNSAPQKAPIPANTLLSNKTHRTDGNGGQGGNTSTIPPVVKRSNPQVTSQTQDTAVPNKGKDAKTASGKSPSGKKIPPVKIPPVKNPHQKVPSVPAGAKNVTPRSGSLENVEENDLQNATSNLITKAKYDELLKECKNLKSWKLTGAGPAIVTVTANGASTADLFKFDYTCKDGEEDTIEPGSGEIFFIPSEEDPLQGEAHLVLNDCESVQIDLKNYLDVVAGVREYIEWEMFKNIPDNPDLEIEVDDELEVEDFQSKKTDGSKQEALGRISFAEAKAYIESLKSRDYNDGQRFRARVEIDGKHSLSYYDEKVKPARTVKAKVFFKSFEEGSEVGSIYCEATVGDKEEEYIHEIHSIKEDFDLQKDLCDFFSLVTSGPIGASNSKQESPKLTSMCAILDQAVEKCSDVDIARSVDHLFPYPELSNGMRNDQDVFIKITRHPEKKDIYLIDIRSLTEESDGQYQLQLLETDRGPGLLIRDQRGKGEVGRIICTDKKDASEKDIALSLARGLYGFACFARSANRLKNWYEDRNNKKQNPDYLHIGKVEGDEKTCLLKISREIRDRGQEYMISVGPYIFGENQQIDLHLNWRGEKAGDQSGLKEGQVQIKVAADKIDEGALSQHLYREFLKEGRLVLWEGEVLDENPK